MFKQIAYIFECNSALVSGDFLPRKKRSMLFEIFWTKHYPGLESGNAQCKVEEHCLQIWVQISPSIWRFPAPKKTKHVFLWFYENNTTQAYNLAVHSAMFQKIAYIFECMYWKREQGNRQFLGLFDERKDAEFKWRFIGGRRHGWRQWNSLILKKSYLDLCQQQSVLHTEQNEACFLWFSEQHITQA